MRERLLQLGLERCGTCTGSVVIVPRPEEHTDLQKIRTRQVAIDFLGRCSTRVRLEEGDDTAEWGHSVSNANREIVNAPAPAGLRQQLWPAR
jgi:hypothetical protein